MNSKKIGFSVVAHIHNTRTARACGAPASGITVQEMQRNTYYKTLFALTLAGCPVSPGSTTSDDGSEMADGSEATGDPLPTTTGDSDDDSDMSTDVTDGGGDAGDGDGDPTTDTGDGDGDAGDGDGDPVTLRWAVQDGNGIFVGWLSTPSAEEISDHDNIFSLDPQDGYPRTLYLTNQSEYGFMLESGGTSYYTIGNTDSVMLFSESACSGQAHDWIAHYTDSGAPLLDGECDDVTIAAFEAVEGVITMQYQDEVGFGTAMDTFWPGATGLVIGNKFLSHYYHLPREQAWPEMMSAVSVRQPDGTCTELAFPVTGCSVLFSDTILDPPNPPGPYSLVELPD